MPYFKQNTLPATTCYILLHSNHVASNVALCCCYGPPGAILSKTDRLLHCYIPPWAPSRFTIKSKLQCPLRRPLGPHRGGQGCQRRPRAFTHFQRIFPLRAPMVPQPASRRFCAFLPPPARFSFASRSRRRVEQKREHHKVNTNHVVLQWGYRGGVPGGL